jgi:rRNA maturation protein Nop10
MWKVARRSTLTAWIPERGQRHTTAQPERYNPDVNNYFTATTRGNNSGLDRFSLVGALQGSRQSAQQDCTRCGGESRQHPWGFHFDRG